MNSANKALKYNNEKDVCHLVLWSGRQGDAKTSSMKISRQFSLQFLGCSNTRNRWRPQTTAMAQNLPTLKLNSC